MTSTPGVTTSSSAWRGGLIVRPSVDRRLDAVEMLLAHHGVGDRAHAERFIEHAERHEIPLDWLWALCDSSGRFLASMLAAPNPGRTAMVFVTTPYAGAGVEAVGELIRLAIAELPSARVALAQVLLDPADSLTRSAFDRGGFESLALLSYMERHMTTGRDRSRVQWPDGIEPHVWSEVRRDDLLRILERSYIETLDCPRLCGLRSTADILEGHLRTGRHDPELWTLLYEKGDPVAALLLNPSPATQSVELVYLGLAPQARRRGLASLLLKHGLSLLCGRTERSIHLAVDEQNAPALRLYRAHGFRTTLRRLAMIRPISATPAK